MRSVVRFSRGLKAAILLSLAAITACGGGGGSPASPTGAAGTLSATVNVSIPGGSMTSSAQRTAATPTGRSLFASSRTPQYLTSYTQGIELAAVQNGTTFGDVFYPLSQLQSYCTSTATGFSCQLKVMVPPGNSQLLVATYDGTTNQSNVLSTASVPISATGSSANNYSVQTNGIPYNVNGGNNVNFNCPTLGTATTQAFNWKTTDADGGTLSGTLGAPITITSSDTSGSVTGGPLTWTTATGTVTVSYNGGTPTNGVAIFSPTVQVTTPSGTRTLGSSTFGTGYVAPIPSTAVGPHYVYYVMSGVNSVFTYDVCAQNSGPTIPLPANTNPVFITFDEVNPTPPRVIVAGGNDTLNYVDINSASVLQTVTLPGLPHHIRQGGVTGNLYITVDPNLVYRYSVHPSGSPYLQTTSPLFVTVGNGPRALFPYSPPSPIYYVVNSTDGTVSSVNLSTMVVLATINVGGSPLGVISNLTSSAASTCVLVGNTSPNSVTSIDPTTNTVINTVPLAGTPLYFTGNSSLAANSTIANTFLAAEQGGTAQLLTCSGNTVSVGATWNNFPSNVTAASRSYIMSGAVLVAGQINGQAGIASYNLGQNLSIWSTTVGTGTISGLASGL